MAYRRWTCSTCGKLELASSAKYQRVLEEAGKFHCDSCLPHRLATMPAKEQERLARRKEVKRLVLEGSTYSEIAKQLSMNRWTVRGIARELKRDTQPRKRKEPPRDDGVIVTFTHRETGEQRVVHRSGPAVEACREVCAKAGNEYVSSISTPRTIRRDLEQERLYDPFQVERYFLGHVGRLDLLDPRAMLRLADVSDRREKRKRDMRKAGLI